MDVFRPAIERWLVAASVALAAWLVVAMLWEGDWRALVLVRNTLLLACGACGVAIPIGAALAFLLLRTDAPGRRFACGLAGTMLLVPLYLQAAGWDAGFGRQGWLPVASGAPGLEGWAAAIWVHGVAATPWVILIVGVGIRLVEPELEEAALLETTPWNAFLRVTLSRSFPWLAVAAAWILVTTAGEITVTDLYQVRTYAEEVYTHVPLRNDSSDAAGTWLLGAPRGVLLVGALIVCSLAATARVAPAELATTERDREVFRLGPYRPLALVGLAGAGAVIVGVPLANLVYQAGLVVRPAGDQWLRGWSGGKLLWLVGTTPGRYAEEWMWSLAIGGASATAAVGLGAVLAWPARRGGLKALPALAIAAVGLALPGPTIGLQLIGLLNRESSDLLLWLYDRTILAPLLAQLVRSLPIAILVCWHALRSVPEELLDAAALEGAGGAVCFWRVVIPQRAASLAAAWLAALAISVGDLSASILVLPPGVTTIPVRVFGLLHSGVDDQVAGIGLTLAIAFAALAELAIALWRRGGGAVRQAGGQRV